MAYRKLLLLILPVFLLFFSCKGFPFSRSAAPRAPAWVSSADSVYGRDRYAAATGFGTERAAAEKNAFAALAAYFGQSVQVERVSASSYQQAVINGVMDNWIDTAEMRTIVNSSAFMDNLMGAEIRDVWFDSRGTYYAVAVMEKSKSIQIYYELIQANLNIINNLLRMTPAEAASMDGVIRYLFAATVADVNVSYRNIVSLLGGSTIGVITGGDSYRLEAQNIAKTIPIGITVTNDRADRIFGAFAKSFSDWGFESSIGMPGMLPGNLPGSSRYMLNVDISLQPVVLPDNPNFFSRIELSANLVDTSQGLVLLPYNFISREGHISTAEAENRCITAAERNINEEYRELLRNYLSGLMPKNNRQ